MMTAPGKASQGLEGLMLLKQKFVPYFRATEMKVKCRSCHSGHGRYLPLNMDGKQKRGQHLLYPKLLIMIS